MICPSTCADGQFRYASVTLLNGDIAPAAMGVTLRAWVVYYPAAYVPLEAFEGASSDGNATAAALLSVYGISWYTRFAQSFDMYFDHVRQRDTFCVEELTIDLYLQYTLSSEWALQPLSIAYIINNRPSGGLGWAEWPALLVRSVYEIYEHTGDLSLLAANYDELLTYTLAPLVDAATGLWTCPDGSTVLNCNQAEVKIAGAFGILLCVLFTYCCAG